MKASQHIIVVDDEAAAREMVGDYLKMHGFSVTLSDKTGIEVLDPDWFEVTREPVPEGLDILLRVKPDPKRRGKVDTFIRFRATVSGNGLPPTLYDDKRVSIQGEW